MRNGRETRVPTKLNDFNIIYALFLLHAIELTNNNNDNRYVIVSTPTIYWRRAFAFSIIQFQIQFMARQYVTAACDALGAA